MPLQKQGVTGNRVKIPSGPATVTRERFSTMPLATSGEGGRVR